MPSQKPKSSDAYADKTAAALASIEAKKRKSEAAGYGVMSAAMGFGEAVERPWMKRLVWFAKAGCIIFAFVIPNVLFIMLVR